jgi:hypothetical protein
MSTASEAVQSSDLAGFIEQAPDDDQQRAGHEPRREPRHRGAPSRVIAGTEQVQDQHQRAHHEVGQREPDAGRAERLRHRDGHEERRRGGARTAMRTAVCLTSIAFVSQA